MWFLTNEKTKRVYYLVPQGSSHTVGRSNTDLVITGDDSISRNHAVLLHSKDRLLLTDPGSRYGSYVNENISKIVPISKDQPTGLKEGDIVQFGRCGSIWMVKRVFFRCLTSTLIMTNQLKLTMEKLGVELLAEYAPEITHLIMPTITVTTKFLQCLVAQVPIVKPEFFTAVESCIEQHKPIPLLDNFIPTCNESYIRNDQPSYNPNPSRRDLFKGKEFVFLNNVQRQQYEDIIKLAGGVCLCAQREKIAKTRLFKPNVVIVKFSDPGSSQSQSQSFDWLHQSVTALGRRMIPDTEIGLAIIFSSTEKYCNPEYSFAFNIEEYKPSAKSGETFARSTEQQPQTGYLVKTEVIDTIPETEPLTERKNCESLEISIDGNSPTTSRRSTRSMSSFAIPETISSVHRIEERRPLKRVVETSDSSNVQKEDNIIKRPRKNTTFENIRNSEQSEEPVANEVHISESQPTPQAVPSHALQNFGFLAVNRLKTKTNNLNQNKTRRNAILMLELEDEGLFNFDDIAPAKKPKLDTSTCNKQSSNDTIELGKTNSQHMLSQIRRQRHATEKEDNLFCFQEKLPTTQPRGATNKRQVSKGVGLIPPPVDNSNATNRSYQCSDGVSSKNNSQNRCAIKNSSMSEYREFIKPIQSSVYHWLSSSLCGLNFNENKEPVVTKIKSEPLDEIDGAYEDNKKWLESAINWCQVQDISMQIVSRKPTDQNGDELSCRTVNGENNFKAFVKKRNYPVQKKIILTKFVRVLDENQEQ
ncbi:nibrin [Anopheles nili]|uniref:nibrin n=1 Tax=Anopheles nili TaxID=185578 RepID=UPI00237ACBED|nr:nibrin [Anopheles nili]